MKELLYFILILAAGGLGYHFEPQLRYPLTGIQPESKVIPGTEELPGAEHPATPTAPSMDLSQLVPSQLPEKILLNVEAKVADTSSGLVLTIEAGNHVKPLRLAGENVFISPGSGAYVGQVAIADTDLVQQLIAHPPAIPSAAPTEPAVATPETPAVTPTEPMIPATGDSQEPSTDAKPPMPEPAAVTPAPVPESAPAAETSAPVPAPDSAPAPDATPTSAAGASSDAVKAMQDSVRAGQIKEFKYDQVLDWKPGDNETVDGESYQTGLASYKAETIFGVKTIQAKALLKNGKVQRWIWPKSGMEIK